MKRYWTPQRKATVVASVKAGHMSADEATKVHGLSLEELTRWIVLYERLGAKGLRVTRRPTRVVA